MKVLIVEDDHFYAQFISEFLRDNSIETTIAQCAHEALSVDINDYSGAVIDIMLPNDAEASGITNEECRGGYATGIAIARRLLQRNAALRILFLSSGVASDEPEKWAAERSVPFVLKSESGCMLSKHALRRLGLVGQKKPP